MMTILLRISTFLIDILFPIARAQGRQVTKYTESVYLNNTSQNTFLRQEVSKTYSHGDVLYALEYRQESIKNMLWRFKYYLDIDALQTCTNILYDQLVADASDRVGRLPFRVPHTLIHYPSSTYFRGDKSFDHMKELMLLLDTYQNLDEPFFICCVHAVLPRKGVISESTSGKGSDEHRPQHTGTRKQRFEWSKARFILSPAFEKYMQEPTHKGSSTQISPATHILYCIDDVVTTGASMQSVSNMLQERFDVEVIKFCICH